MESRDSQRFHPQHDGPAGTSAVGAGGTGLRRPLPRCDPVVNLDSLLVATRWPVRNLQDEGRISSHQRTRLRDGRPWIYYGRRNVSTMRTRDTDNGPNRRDGQPQPCPRTMC